MVKKAASAVSIAVPTGYTARLGGISRCRFWMVSEGDLLAGTPDRERLRFLSAHAEDLEQEIGVEQTPICALRLLRGQLFLEEQLAGLGVLTIVGLLAAAVVHVCDERNPQVSDWQRQRVLEFPDLMRRLVRGDYRLARGLDQWGE